MSLRVSVFVATSLDGYIARKDGAIDWLNEANNSVPEGEDCGFQAFMDSVDILIMGRNTYEQVLSFGQWPYGKTQVIVLSRNSISIPSSLSDSIVHSSESPKAIVERLNSHGVKRVYLDGGYTIQRFLSESLIDEITVTVIPVILGDGISLFGPLDHDIKLIHLNTTVFEFGFVQTTYSVHNDGKAVVAD